MGQATALYVLDTSAWLTLIEDEAGADTVQALLEKARAGEVVVLVSFMSFMEVYYIRFGAPLAITPRSTSRACWSGSSPTTAWSWNNPR
jgi:predicted nucleic acid-binding protein